MCRAVPRGRPGWGGTRRSRERVAAGRGGAGSGERGAEKGYGEAAGGGSRRDSGSLGGGAAAGLSVSRPATAGRAGPPDGAQRGCGAGNAERGAGRRARWGVPGAQDAASRSRRIAEVRAAGRYRGARGCGQQGLGAADCGAGDAGWGAGTP